MCSVRRQTARHSCLARRRSSDGRRMVGRLHARIVRIVTSAVPTARSLRCPRPCFRRRSRCQFRCRRAPCRRPFRSLRRSRPVPDDPVPPDTWLRSSLMSSWITCSSRLDVVCPVESLSTFVSRSVRRWSSDRTLLCAASPPTAPRSRAGRASRSGRPWSPHPASVTASGRAPPPPRPARARRARRRCMCARRACGRGPRPRREDRRSAPAGFSGLEAFVPGTAALGAVAPTPEGCRRRPPVSLPWRAAGRLWAQ